VRRLALAAALAAPGLTLAAIGTTHPTRLDSDTAQHWWAMHIGLLPLFPLLGAALWWVVRHRARPVSGIAAGAAAVFALGYTALDVLAGIGAGFVIDRDPGAAAARNALFEIGDAHARVGVWAFLVLAVIVGATVTIDAARTAVEIDWAGRSHPPADPAAMVRAHRAITGAGLSWLVLVTASVSFMDSHIYRWQGVIAMLGIGLATGALSWVDPGPPPSRPPITRSPQRLP
jgi:hypothetical protein